MTTKVAKKKHLPRQKEIDPYYQQHNSSMDNLTWWSCHSFVSSWRFLDWISEQM